MKWVSSSLSRGTLLAAMAVLVFSGCKPPKPPPPQPVKETPPPPPPPAKPTVTLQANPASINKGDAATLSWTSTDATQLTISPEVGAVTAQGSTQVHPADSTTFTITASGPGGSADASARVTVSVPPPPPPKESDEEIFAKRVKDAYFDFNKFDIRADAREALGQTAGYLRDYPQIKVTIEGHCDERGSTEYNLTLGDRRASAVKQYMVSLGISADRMSTVSYGKEKPFCGEHTEECWQSNRRGHFIMAK